MITLGSGIVGVAGIAACLYMTEHGYEWWQVALMALFTLCVMPRFSLSYSHKEDAE